jgi:hypothetical protein
MMIQIMNLRRLVVTYLPQAAIGSAIIWLINVYTEGMTAPVRLATEFLLYTLALFIGFVIVDMVLNTDSASNEE